MRSPVSSSAGRSRASVVTGRARSCACCPWRSRTSSPSPWSRMRCAARWRGAAFGSARSGRGRRARRRCCSWTAPATTVAPPARRSSRRAGRARSLRRWPRPRGPRERRFAPPRRSSTSPRATGARPASCSRAARRSPPEPSSRARTPSAPSSTSSIRWSSVPRSGWRAGNIRTPGVVAKVNLALKKLPASSCRRRERGAAARADRRRAGHRRDRASLRRDQVRPLERPAGPRGDDPVDRGSVARRGREGRHARHERRSRSTRRTTSPAWPATRLRAAPPAGTAGARPSATRSSRSSSPWRRGSASS